MEEHFSRKHLLMAGAMRRSLSNIKGSLRPSSCLGRIYGRAKVVIISMFLNHDSIMLNCAIDGAGIDDEVSVCRISPCLLLEDQLPFFLLFDGLCASSRMQCRAAVSAVFSGGPRQSDEANKTIPLRDNGRQHHPRAQRQQ